jgi:hypothetical protein
MRMPFAAGILIVLGVLAGCASSASEGWTKPGATEEQVNRESADCLFDAQSTVPGGSRGPGMVVNQDRYRQCMAGRGYTARPTK